MFTQARLKLTAWYLLIIMLVSLSFSSLIYKSYSDEVTRFEQIQRERFERRFLLSAPPPQMQDLLEDTKHRVLITLILINGLILFSSGGLGFILAGRTLRPIKEMVDEQNRFISDASHELKTPLTSLKSVFEVYLRDKEGGLTEAKQIISESVTEVNKLQSLTEYLLKLSRFQKPNNSFETVPLKEIVATAVKKITPLAKIKNIEIITKTENLYLAGDKNNLAELVTILLDNAVKYSPPGKPVTVSLEKDKNIVLKVEDHGVGINENDLPHIFERFYRAQKSRSDDGFGLGLAIAKEIVKMHGGLISVKSQEGYGTIFTVTFHA